MITLDHLVVIIVTISFNFSQLYHDGFGPHASLLEQAALSTNRAVGPSDRLKQMLSLCAHTVREVDNYFDDKFSSQSCMEFSCLLFNLNLFLMQGLLCFFTHV